jgi:predicted DNA-binding mobile mystery protein A
MLGLGIKQIDRSLNRLRSIAVTDLNIPKGGWLKTIREALGITLTQLARRLGVTKQAVLGVENSEKQGSISLNTLEKFAESLDCKMVYFLIPNSGLEDMVETQIRRKAESMIKHISHSMSLENQQNPDEVLKEQLEDLIEQIRYEVKTKKNRSFIWEDEE